MSVTAAAPRRTVSRAPLTSRGERIAILLVGLAVAAVPVVVSIQNLTLSSQVSPGLALSSAVVWTLYTVPFLVVIHRIDFFEHEPWPSLVAALLWGGLVAAGMALLANDAIFELVTVTRGVLIAQEWGAAIAGPTTEEIAKGVGVLLILLVSPRRPRTALDGFVIGAVVGLGFQVVENFGYTMNVAALEDDPGAGPLIEMFVIRGLIAGPFSHAVYTGIVGLGLGYLVTATSRSWLRRMSVAVLAFLGAYVAHWFWNSPLLTADLGVLALLAKGAVTLGFLIVGLRIARRRDAEFFSVGLTHVPAWLCTPAEQQALASGRTRRRARKQARRVGGRIAARETARLQRAQADLAVAVRTGDQAAADNAIARISAARSCLPVSDAHSPAEWAPPQGPPTL